MIIHQLDSAVATLRETADRIHTRRGWLRACGSTLAVGYAVWLATTLGLAVISLHESSSQENALVVYLSIPIGVLACMLGIGTMELFFRHDRRAQRWLIEEIEKDRENRLLRHMPVYREDWS